MQLLHPDSMQPMTPITFWSLIDKTIPADGDQEAQLLALHDVLDQLGIEEIESFEAAFQNQIGRAYTWDLWDAAHVIHGGFSDDGFEYFQRWLIAQGRDLFETALESPDELAEIIPDAMQDTCEFEDFVYVAMDVWTRKTGFDALSDPASSFPKESQPPQPTGTPFKDAEAYLSRRYPKLWDRFDQEPLG
jgi:Protein of unknown function (DUF4240)